MGDVFDAMNRSKRERSGPQPAPPSPPVPPGGVGGAETPALPIEQVAPAAEAARDQEAIQAPTRMPPVNPVTVAAEKSQERQQQRRQQAALAAAGAAGDPKLNGYAAEIVVHHDRGSVITEQYRAIRTQILARCRNRRLQTHTVTSSAPNEGKSVTTVNLGIAFSELRDQKVLLVEGDLRKPTFSKLFDRTFDAGLIQLLNGEVEDLDKVLQRTVYDNLQFLPAGGRDLVSSTELLSSPRMVHLLERLKDRYDHIFIDTPPIVTVTDAAIMGAMSDQTLLVVRLNHTPVEVVDRAKRLLRAANCELAGVILTHMQYHIPKYLYRYA